jgi:hypothetical protein
MRLGQIAAFVTVVGLIGLALALGVVIGYGIYSEKTATTSIIQISTTTETQTMTTVEQSIVTVTPYCCVDAHLYSGTTCNEIVGAIYPSIQILEYRIDTDPSFIAAEQGSDYSLPIVYGCGGGFSNVGTPPEETILFQSTFAIDRLYTDNCGDVGDFTYYLYVNVLLTGVGYNMSAIQIMPINSSEITISCSSTLTTTGNTTVTITGTTSA